MSPLLIVSFTILLINLGYASPGIHRESLIDLPGQERISKRSSVSEFDTFVFLPNFGRHIGFPRPVRSTFNASNDETIGSSFPIQGDNEDSMIRQKRSLIINENDMDTAANTIVFRPLFRRGGLRRRLREADDSFNQEDITSRRRRSLVNDLETAANNIVFRPLFRRGGSRRRYLRDVDDVLDREDITARHKRSLAKNSNDEYDLETASNMVFRPLFGRGGSRRHRREIDDSYDSDEINNEEMSARPKRSLTANANDNYNGDLDTAANSIVFRPLFRRGGSRRRIRDVDDIAQQHEFGRRDFVPRPKRSLEQEGSDLETSNNIVFRPLFRRGGSSRRVRDTAESLENKDDLDTANNIIFRPLFRRGGSGRHIREVSVLPKSSMDDLEEASSMVFRPLFHNGHNYRRFRRYLDTF